MFYRYIVLQLQAISNSSRFGFRGRKIIVVHAVDAVNRSSDVEISTTVLRK